jgi:hypothetical protein
MIFQSSILPLAVLLVSVIYPAISTSAPAPANTNDTAAQPLVVFVHKSNPVDNLTRDELRRILLFEHTQWAHGRRHSVALLPPGAPERVAALRIICQFSEHDYERHLLQLAYTGNLQARPKELANPANLRKFIFNVPGAIGLGRAADVDDTVKVVRIDGHHPGEAGYPLHLAAK